MAKIYYDKDANLDLLKKKIGRLNKSRIVREAIQRDLDEFAKTLRD